MKRVAGLGVLAIVLAAPALAQAVTVAQLNQDVFRALQFLKAKSVWGETDARLVRGAVIKDGKIDAAEAATLEALREGSFEFTIQGVQSATFKPKDVVLKGTLDAAGVALLAISEADLSASVNQKPDESRAAFLVRRGKEGAVELAALVESEPKAREEARTLFADRFNAAIVADAKNGNSANQPTLRQTISGDLDKAESLPAAGQEKWRVFLTEAAVLLVRKNRYPIRIFAKLFGGEQQAEAQAPIIAKQLGLPE